MTVGVIEEEVAPAMPWRVHAQRLMIAAVAVAALVMLGSSIAEIETFRSSIPDVASYVLLGYVLAAITAGIACLLALVIVWRASARDDARFLALFLATFAFFWGALFHFLHVTHGVESGKQQLGMSVTMGGALPPAVLGAVIMSAAAFLNFAAVFPSAVRRPRGLSASRVWLVALTLVIIDLLPTYLDLFGVDLSVVFRAPKWVLGVLLGYLLATHVVLPVFAILCGVLLLVWNYRHATVEERRSAGWVVAGFAFALGVLLIALLLAVFSLVPDNPKAIAFVMVVLPSIAPLVIVLSLAVAVFYTGTFDPGLVIRKTTIYASVGIVATGLFALVENVISNTISRWLHLPNGVGTFAGSIAVALAIVPLRDRVARLIEQRPKVGGAAPEALPPAQDT